VREVASTEAVAGAGLVGDHAGGGNRQVTLIDESRWRDACREVGREQARGDTPVAATSPASPSGTAAPAPAQKQLVLPQPQPVQPQQRRQFRPAQIEQMPAQNAQPSLRDFFGGFGTAPRQAPPAAGPQRTPIVPGAPRPPGNVGRSAEVPPGNYTR